MIHNFDFTACDNACNDHLSTSGLEKERLKPYRKGSRPGRWGE